MKPEKLLELTHMAAVLRDELRHCYTEKGRRESVAEHSWRLALMALFAGDAFPDADINKVIKMCLIHDLGEMFTGDIPAFKKTKEDGEREEKALFEWVDSLPEKLGGELRGLYLEMKARESYEAKIYKTFDIIEALIAHNESDISTWTDNDLHLQKTIAFDKAEFSPFMKEFRGLVWEESLEKINSDESGRFKDK